MDRSLRRAIMQDKWPRRMIRPEDVILVYSHSTDVNHHAEMGRGGSETRGDRYVTRQCLRQVKRGSVILPLDRKLAGHVAVLFAF